MPKSNVPTLAKPIQDLVQVMGARSTRALIQWPTPEELDGVSGELKRISNIGVSLEAKGDYFRSGDLAYQLHEIVRATRELLKKSLRARGQ